MQEALLHKFLFLLAARVYFSSQCVSEMVRVFQGVAFKRRPSFSSDSEEVQRFSAACQGQKKKKECFIFFMFFFFLLSILNGKN